MKQTHESRVDALRLAFERRAAEESKVVTLVTTCRQEGVSWHMIGEALNMTRQAAWEKYKHVESLSREWDWDTHKGGPEAHLATCHCGKPAKSHVVWSYGCGNVCGIHARQLERRGLGAIVSELRDIHDPGPN